MTGLIIIILAVVIVTAVINHVVGTSFNLFFICLITYLLIADWCFFTPVSNTLTGENKPSIVGAAYHDFQSFVDKTEKEFQHKRKIKQYIQKCYEANITTTKSTPRGLQDWCKFKAKKSLK